MLIGGLDIGTTGCKLTVFDEKGIQLHKAYCDYPVKRAVGLHEIEAEAVFDGVRKIICETAGLYPDIAGIGVTSFGETFVLTDENGLPLYHSMLYTDPHGKEQCSRLCEKIGAEKISMISGLNPHEMFSIPKIMWVKENHPDLFARVKHIFLMEDFIVFRLTGMARIDYSLATRTMGFDIRKLGWSREIFDAAGIDPELMSEAVPTGTVAGRVTETVAQEMGLSPGTQIICVSHDQIAAAIGAGAFDSDTAVDGAGTVECLTPIYDTVPDMKTMAKGNYSVVPYVIPGKYVCYAFSYTGGALIQWCVETLAGKEMEEAKKKGISVNQFLERQSESPTGLLVLPHFAGAATPYMDSGSKGAILGLTVSSTVSDIYRGCMEGVVYEMMLNLEFLKDTGICFRRIRATGGGASSETWLQMKADVLDFPVTSLNTVNAGTVGSAMLTGVAVGCFADLKEAASVMVHEIRTFEPDKEMHRRYMEVYARYRDLYRSIRKLV
jgi:xylulokinase